MGYHSPVKNSTLSNTLRDVALWGFLLALLGMIGLRAALDQHGPHGVHVSYEGAQDVRAHLWHDALDPEAALIEWSTYIWSDDDGPREFGLRSSGDVTVVVNDEAVFSSDVSERSRLEAFTAPMQAGANLMVLRYDGPASFDHKTQIGLYEKSLVWLPVNPYRLYINPPSEADVTSSGRYLLLARMSFLAVLAGMALILARVAARILTRREVIPFALLIVFAAVVRLIVLDQREASDPAFYNMDAVWDNYVLFSRRMLVDDFPLAGSHFQQANIAYLGAVQFLFGPSLNFLQIWNSLFGVLAVIFIFLAARDAFGRAGGYAAGFVAAAYAPMLFYQQSLNIAALAIWLLSAVALALVWFIKRGDWRAAAFFGVMMGLVTMTRSTAAFALGAGLLAVLMRPVPRPKRVLLAAAMVIGMVLVMLPLYLANLSVGLNSPTSNAGGLAFYLNNNRHADGLNGPETEAVQLARLRGNHFEDEFVDDLQTYPRRWVELEIRKAGLLFNRAEHADDNMLDFRSRGVEASSLLTVLNLWGLGNHQFLMALILWGGGLLMWSSARHRNLTLALALIPIGYGAGLMLFFVAARGRIPIVAPAMVLVGALPLGVWKAGALRSAALLPLVIVFMMGTNWIADNMPRPTTVGGLPGDGVATPVTFNDQIRLLGYSRF